MSEEPTSASLMTMAAIGGILSGGVSLMQALKGPPKAPDLPAPPSTTPTAAEAQSMSQDALSARSRVGRAATLLTGGGSSGLSFMPASAGLKTTLGG